ncbi:Nucleoside-diphosphate-sugar epimerase [Tenacibaculum sp. 190524A05c]|uniref:NAD(P)H-binding protein n=1 Tax=Tenacibaculum platacis TaxID=3137852 RepID=UPI0031FA6FB9
MKKAQEVYSILGSGWLGTPLAMKFINDGVTVKGSTRSEEKLTHLKELNILPFIVDIEDEISNSDFFNTDVLLIMITSKEISAYENLISQIEKSVIKKVIFISSTSVYPRNNKTYTEEDETIDDALLVRVEELFRRNSNFKTTIIRFAGLYGGKRQPGNWFAEKEIPQPDGFVNMIHRDDCIAIISQIIEKDVFGETFNACADHHPTRKEFYTEARKNLGKPEPKFKKEIDFKFKKISPKKLMNTLNYKFIHNNLLDLKE